MAGDGSAWHSTANAIAVGSASTDTTRQIIGVAAGSEATDAVNVAQLQALDTKYDAQLAQGFNVKSGGATANLALNGTASPTLEFAGDDNIKASLNGTKVSYSLNKAGITNTLSDTFAKVDASNLTDDNVASWKTKLGVTESQINNASAWDIFGNGADKVTTVAKGGQVKFVDGENTTATVTKDAEGKATVIFDLKNTISLGKDGAEGHIGLNGKDGLTDIRTGSGAADVNGKVGERATRILYKDPKGAEQQVATLADGLRFKGDSGEAAKSLNSVMTIKGADANISTAVNDGGDMLISLGKNLKVDSLAAGGTVIGKEGISVKGSDGNAVAITKNGIDAGGKAISNVGRGVNADDAVTKAQLDEVANHAGANLLPAVHELGSRVNRVGAGAAALAALHPQNFDPDDKWDFSAGYGNYRGANALAVGAFYRPNGTTMISVGGSFGGGENMLNAGVSLKFGSHNPYAGYSGAALHGVIADQDRQIAELKQVVASQREEMQTMKAQMQTILQRLDTLKN